MQRDRELLYYVLTYLVAKKYQGTDWSLVPLQTRAKVTKIRLPRGHPPWELG